MKILFIPQWYPTSITPNAGSFNLEIAKAISRFAELTVITIHFDKNEKFGRLKVKKGNSQQNELEYHTGYSKIPKTSFIFKQRIYNQVIFDYLKSNKVPDIVHTQDLTSFFIIKALKNNGLVLPVVVSQHWSIFFSEKINFIIKNRFRYIFKNAALILPAFKNALNEYKRFGFNPKTNWLPNSIDIDIFYPDVEITKEKLILHVSGFTKVKRIEDIIESFNNLIKYDNEFKLILIGDGVLKGHYMQLATDILPKNSFEFLGFLPKSDIAKYLQKALCFVFPSTFETFGVALIEAAATGCPIITTRSGGIPFVLEKDEAHFVEVGDTMAITKFMINILNKESKIDYIKVSENVREKFSEIKISKLLEEIYGEIVC